MKRILSLIFALVMIFSLCAAVSADTVLIAGDWSLITEDGSVWEISSYIGEEKEVSTIVQYGSISLTTLGSHAFANNEVTESVSILSPISVIGDYAFLNAVGVVTVSMTPSVKTIGTGAFSGTAALREVNLEDSTIKSIAPYLFLNSGIEEVSLPDTCVSISHDAFAGCSQLKMITIPASVTEIADSAFSGCEKLVIHAPYGSYAITYAIAHGIGYVYSDLEAYTFVRGDADLDNAITIMDATRIQRYLVHFENTNPDGRIDLRAAFGSDGKVSILDATRIQRYIAKFNDPYNIGETVTVYLTPDGTVVDTVTESAETE